MATQLLKTVKPSGGDYTSLEACMNANEQNLVTADQYFDVEIDGTWSSADTTTVTIHNYTTDATRYINIYTTAAARHDGKGSLDTGAYRLIVDALDGRGIFGTATYITFTGLQIDSVQYRAIEISSQADANNLVSIDKCILWGVGPTVRSWGATNAQVLIKNSIVFTDGGDGIVCNSTAGVINSYNVIGIAGTGNAFSHLVGTHNVTNCYAYSASGTAIDSSCVTTTSASDDGSDGSATVAYSTSSGAYFTNVTSGSEDFHITNTSSDLYQAGTDLSATFTDDIDGDTRSAWDIGVDYIESGGASSSPSSSPSSSASSSPSESASSSPSSSASSSPSTSASESPSESASSSPSSSPSDGTPSTSPSTSASSSPSESPSSSVSESASESPSSTPSASPSEGTEIYSRGNYAALPADDADLETAYSVQDYLDVDADDAVRISQAATGEYAIHQFKDYVGAASAWNLTWNGQSDLAPSSSNVVLQIYNQVSTTWETLDTESTASANTDFNLTGSISADAANYKTASNMISCRVYQLAVG